MINPKEKISLGEKMAQSSEYWKSLGLSEVDRAAVPHDFFSEGKYESRTETLVLHEALQDRLHALTQGHDLPLFVLMTAALYVELSKYNRQPAFTVGIPAYGGSRQQGEQPLANQVLPCKIGIPPESTVRELLRAVQAGVLACYDHQYCDVEQVLRSADLCGDLLELTSANISLNTLHSPGHIDSICRSPKNQLAVCVDKREDGSLAVSFVYNSRLFKEESISLFGARFIHIISELAADLDRPVSGIEIITAEEKQLLLHDFNDTFAGYPLDSTVKEQFEAQAAATPDHIAVECGGQTLTYRELNAKANQLARLLREQGVEPDQLVAILAHGSLELMIAMAAVWKAGGAYVPIDVSYPDDRKEYMLRDSGARLVLTTPGLTDGLAFDGKVVDLTDGRLYTGDDSNLETTASARSLVYVIYTSGSTGNPKGVMIENRSLLNYLSYCRASYQENGIGDFPLFTSISFDLTVTSMYVPLLSGHKLTIYDTSDKLSFLHIVKQKLDIMKLTPAHLSVINGLSLDEISISKFIVGGEELSYPLTDSVYRKFGGNTDIINEYGPTEATVGCIVYRYEPKERWEKTLPIGKPISNTRIYILDQDRRLAPIGVVGELWIAGDGLARGYWGQPELTEQKFVPDPFRAGERMYRSGDIARWLPDGNIEFFGRADHQVKLRGFRIELGEIEARLLGHPDVKEAVVLALENEQGEKYLSAYYVGTTEANAAEIKEYLRINLPEYMVPSYFTPLRQMPLTGNGKVDRKALPKPDVHSRRALYEAPRDEVEAKLAEIWSEVLGVEQVGIHDNFFDLGGDSIKAIRIASKLQKYGYQLKVKELFDHATLQEAGRRVTAGQSAVRQEAVTGEAVLTPIQRMFFELNLTDAHHWNQSVMLYRREGFSEEILREVLTCLVTHHDALRMTYRQDNGRVIQWNRPADDRLFELTAVDVRGEAEAEEAIRRHGLRLQSSMRLEQGPLVKAGLFRTGEGDHLLLAIHHLVVDGVSWRILLEDFSAAYEQALQGETLRLQAKTDSFQAWGAYLQGIADSGRLQEEAGYWERIESADVKPLPVDHHLSPDSCRPQVKDQHQVSIEFSREETDDLLKRTNRAYGTDINAILLTALALAVREWTKEPQVLVSLEGHGREPLDGTLDISRTVGWFTTHYPVLLQTGADVRLAEAIKGVKETLKRIPGKGIGYGILKHLGGGRAWKASPQISFNYLGQFDEALQGGLFELSKLSGGPSISPDGEPLYDLDIVGDISGHRLALTLAYSRHSYEDSTMAELAASYKRHLLAIISHCVSRPDTERTPSDYLAGDLELEELEALKARYESGLGLRIKEIYPLTPMQEGMLFHSLLGDPSGAYVEQRAFTVEGRFDVERFEESFHRLLDRYEILKSVVVHEGLQSPKQLIVEGRRASFRCEDLSAWTESERTLHVREFETADRAQRFRLSEDPLNRLTVFRLGGERFRIVWSWHHILMDGWCGGIVLQDLFRLYASLASGEEAADQAWREPAPYSDYVKWLQRQSRNEAGRYWARYLEGYETMAQIPGSPAAGGQAYRKAKLEFTLSQASSEALTAVGRQAQVTLNTVIGAVWGILLQNYVNSEDVVFGAVVSGRNAEVERIEEMVGLFINTIPVRVKSDQTSRFTDLLQSMQRQALESAPYDYYALADIQALAGVKRKLVNHLVTFQNYYVDESLNRLPSSLELRVTDASIHEQNNYDLAVMVIPGDEVKFVISYNEQVYDPAAVDGIRRHLMHIIQTVSADADIPVSGIELTTPEEKRQIVYDFNRAVSADAADPATIVERFEAQAARRPEHPAVVAGNRQLTYRELNERSSRLARMLRSHGVGADTLVGLLAEPSVEMVIGMLGILKSGGAYVPMDPGQPEERIRYVLDDAGVQIVVTAGGGAGTSGEGSSKLKAFQGLVLDLTDGGLPVNESGLHSGETGNPAPVHTRDSLAYVIYTSGTTGQSKGVMVTHSGLANYVNAMIEKAGITDEDATALLSSYAFDLGYTAVYTALAGGITLHLPPEETYKDPDALVRYALGHCTYLKMTPSLFQLLLLGENLEQIVQTSRLRLIILGGEPFNPKHLEQFYGMDREGRVRFMNHYGPTESTIGCAAELLPREGIESFAGVIGRPLAGCRIYIADRQGHLAPVGVPGELWVAGAGVARGYLGRPDLTAEKFTENPWVSGERLYRTGDLAKWRADGQIEYIGRIDNQVKIRGYRIEPGEIEAKLLSCPSVQEAVVLPWRGGGQDALLAAYLVGPQRPDIAGIRDELMQALPHYMVPSVFTLLERMPLTSNGKVDRRALPEPDFRAGAAGEYAAPRTEIEARLAEVWSEVLGAGRVGIRDNFFDLGGDSIKAIRIVSKLQKYGYRLDMKELFQRVTIQELSAKVTTSRRVVSQEAVTGEAALTPIQAMFFEQNRKDPHHWNQAVMLYSREGFDERAVRQVFRQIAVHHDALRMVYRVEGARILQFNRGVEEPLFDLTVLDYRGQGSVSEAVEEQCSRIQGSIDLQGGPLVQLGLFHTDEGDHLLIAIHHLAVDGVSWRILFEDFSAGYSQALQGQPVVFQSKTNSFREWAAFLQEQAAGELLQAELPYWQRLKEAAASALPAGRGPDEHPGRQLRHYRKAALSLSPEETEALLKQTSRAYRTEINDLLLAALALAVRKWTAADQVLVTLEGHGRENLEGDIDISRTVGWFTTHYPVLLPLQEAGHVGTLIKEVKETLRRVPHKGIGYGMLAYLGDHPALREVKPQIKFNYLGQFDGDIDQGVFELSPLSAGQDVSPHGDKAYDLEIVGTITDRRLEIVLSYNGLLFDEETMEQVAAWYQAGLLSVIDHCRSRAHSETTPSDYPAAPDLDLQELERLKAKVEEEKGYRIEDIYSLTPMQEGMLFHSLLNQGSGTYVEQKSFIAGGDLDTGLLEQSFRRLARHYEILRTAVVHEGLKTPKQLILGGRPAEFHYEDISGLDPQRQADYMAEWEEADRRRGFDLAEDSLLRLSVLKLGEARHKVVWSSHHILMDGWCSGIIIGDLFVIYGAMKHGRTPVLSQPPRFADYIQWLQSRNPGKARQYWASQVEGYATVARIPGYNDEAGDEPFQPGQWSFTVGRELTAALTEIGKEAQVTLNTVIQAVWGLLLQRYTNSEDVVFGSVVSGRNAEVDGIEQMVGLFINTIPIRVRTDEHTRFVDVLGRLQQEALEAAKYDYYPLAEIQSLSEVKGKLVNHILIFQNNAIDELVKAPDGELGFTMSDITVHEQTNYDLDVMVFPNEELTFMLSYNEAVYDRQQVRKLEDQLLRIMEAVVRSREVNVSRIDMLTEAEQRQLTEEFNATALEFAREQTVHGLIEEQAGRTPERTAVHFGGQSLTYRELNAKANQLARVLRSEGVGPDTVVGLMVPRSLEMLVGILGILKAGGAYLPLDPSHPKDRIGYMLEDAQVRLLLTSGGLEGLAGELRFGGALLDVMSEELYQGDDTSLEPVNSSRDLAYVLYTSGSTGNPKGVMVEHRQVSNFITAIVEATELTRSDSILCLTTISFDIFGLETLVPLAHGMQVIVGSEEEGSDGTKLATLIRRFGIEAMQSTPSRLKLLLEHAAFREALGGMQRILIGGEELPAALWERLQAYDRLAVYNVYGPTETTIWSTVKRMETGAARLTIGKPIGNTQIYMVDAQDQLTPVGVPGHMCIAGDGVTRGYLGRPELTAEKFVDNPFVPGTRMYKTGDLARWLPSGEIEFLGRMDNQVKIRGYRIELGEIEHRLAGHAAVKEAVVTARTDESGQPYLCAYFVGLSGPVEKGELKGHLKAGLPEYMIPAYFVQLEEIPLTSNGKVNRKALPAPDESALVTGGYEAPQTAVEETLAAIWSRVLGVAQVGIHDSFFDLGGHSLKATLLMSGIHQKLQVEVPLQELFRRPTIRELAGYIETAGARAYEAIEPVAEQAWYEASSAQKRMYALQQLDPQSTAYHMPGVYELEGRVDVIRLERALKGLVQRHEALRTSFAAEDGEIVQRIEREASFGVPARSYGEKPIEAIAADFVKPFELERAPLFRAELAEAGGRTYLLLDMHHIISDGVSMGILVKDFVRLYNGEELEPLRIQYKDYAAWHNRRLREGELAKQEAYWTAQFEDGVPVLRLPYDYERPALQSFEGERLHFTLGGEATQGLRVLAKEQEATMPMVLMSVFTILLSKYSGQEDIVVGTPVAGRPHADLQEMVGMFVNTLALRSRPAGGKTYRAYLQEIKMSSLQAYDHQSYPLEQLAEKLGIRRDLSRNPLFDAVFNWNNVDYEQAGDEDGLWFKPVPLEANTSRVDISLSAFESRDDIELTLTYASRLFMRQTMERLIGDFRRIVGEVTSDSEKRLQDIELLSDEDRTQVMQEKEAVLSLRGSDFDF
ncbi:non-ribosomal peptide synthetase [Paenibacillus mucilaginosus]|uniref:Bacillorin synthetase B n=1 Tax=Paenibacillus mucilaginosus (strain KNP414) TaxID=1036673 RepID=F8F8J0_PAEMK|nr:non-ribosomal peptide synthetase [Paenibacillus mucilaginosus]AEI41578.1 bacillorin synthetase B [Paenibacillus mucilaginosus KNP414]